MLKVNGQSNLQDISVNNITIEGNIDGQVVMSDLNITGNIISPKFRAFKPVNNIINLIPNLNSPSQVTMASNITCNGGTLLFFIDITIRSTNRGLRGYNFHLVNETINQIYQTFESFINITSGTANHEMHISMPHIIASVPAGIYKIDLQRINTDVRHGPNSFANVTILEMPY